MRKRILLFLLISSNIIQAQPHGTLITAIICEDGIILSADSRSSYPGTDLAGNVVPTVAYFDSCRKIFPLGIFHIGITGTLNIGNTSWWDIIEKFNKRHRADTSVELAYNNFKYYLTEKLRISDSTLSRNSFFVVGYEKATPVILYDGHGEGIQKANKPKFRIISRDCIRNDLFLDEYSCKNVIEALEVGYKKCKEPDVGGPLNILKINQDNSVSEVKTFSFKRYKSTRDLLRSILSGNTKMTYLYANAEEFVKKDATYWLKHKIRD